MGKQIYIVAGGKGGVGKSTIASAVAGVLEVAKESVVVADADFLTGDVAARYPRNSFRVDLNAEKGWAQLADAVGKLSAKIRVVLNQGADVSGTDARYARDAVEALSEMQARITLLWVLVPSRESAEHLARSLESGVMRTASRKVVVLNACDEGIEAADFEAWRESETRKVLVDAGAVEVFVPHLYRDFMNALRGIPFSKISSLGDNTNFFARVRIRRWWESVSAALGLVLLDRENGDGDRTAK